LNITVRKATARDAPVLAYILRELGIFAQVGNEIPESTQARLAGYLQFYDSDDCHSLYVAVSNTGEIVGYRAVHWNYYLFLVGPEGCVSEQFVCTAERGRSIGSRLLEAIKVEALARGCSRLMLINLRHRESYERGFCARRGWEERPDAASFVYVLEQGSSPSKDEVE
jgi:GNAT superfamily N-acetyltransferase